MELNLLAPATVLSVRGTVGFEHMKGWCRGIFDKPPYIRVSIDYPANLEPNSITEGVRLLDEQIRSTVGNIILFGHSQGAQVISAWMDKYRDDPTAPGPDRLMAVLTGNPQRYPTGRLVGGFVVGGGIGKATSITTPWRIVDVARQGDSWAVRDNTRSFWQQLADMVFDLEHANYYFVDLTAEPLSVQQYGNTTSIVVP